VKALLRKTGHLALTVLLVSACGVSSDVPARCSVTPAVPSGSGTQMVHIQVQVLGGQTPLSGMRVELYRGQFIPKPGELVAASTTDERGIVELAVEAGTYGVWVRSLEFGSQWRYEGPTAYQLLCDQQISVRMLPDY
jgi:hypothetical protein